MSQTFSTSGWPNRRRPPAWSAPSHRELRCRCWVAPAPHLQSVVMPNAPWLNSTQLGFSLIISGWVLQGTSRECSHGLGQDGLNCISLSAFLPNPLGHSGLRASIHRLAQTSCLHNTWPADTLVPKANEARTMCYRRTVDYRWPPIIDRPRR